MKKQLLKVLLMIGVVLFLVGLKYIFGATTYGLNKGSKAIEKNGGSIETNKYYLVVEAGISNSRVAGTMIAMTGCLMFLISEYQLYKDSEGEM